MKITLPNHTTILIREEDLLEATVGLDEISYSRPSGTRVIIKLHSTLLSQNTENRVPAAMKKVNQDTGPERKASATIKRRIDPPKYDEGSSSKVFSKFDEMQTQITEIKGKLNSWAAEVVQKIEQMESRISHPSHEEYTKENTIEAQKIETMDESYSAFIDYCLKISPKAEPGDHPDGEIKQYLLSCIKNSTLTFSREGDAIWNSVEDSKRIMKLFKKYRKKGLPTDL